MLLTLPLLPQLFADSVTDSCSSLFHYPCPPPHSSPQYLMAESEVTDQSLHPPWAAYDCMAFCSMVCQDTSPLLSSLLELLSVRVDYILAEGVLLKCVANGLHRGINMEMNVHHYRSLRSVKKDRDWYRYWYSLGTVNAAKKKMYDVRIIAGAVAASLCRGWLVTTCCYYSVLWNCLYFQSSSLPLRCGLMWFNPTFPEELTAICLWKPEKKDPSSAFSNDNCAKWITKKWVLLKPF